MVPSPGGQLNGEGRALPRDAVDPHRPAVCLGDGADDGQPQTGPFRPPGLGPAGEAFEDAFLVLLGDPDPGVGHPQPDPPASRAGPERDPVAVAGVLHGVGGELQQRLGETLAVGQDGRLGHLGDGPLPAAEGAGLGHDLDGQVGNINGCEGQEVGLLGLGEHDEVVHDPAHPLQLIGDQGGGVAPVGRVVAHQLQVPADDRDRRAELVAGVVQEPPLSGEGRLQPVQHVVEGPGQLGDVVVSADRDPPGQVGFADPLGRLADQPDRRQHPSGQQPAH
jgi:hypothetical protein